MQAIRVENLSVKKQDASEDYILKNISGAFDIGSMTAILGPNGAGKSTLIRIITGLIKPSNGQVKIANTIASHIGLLPQLNEIDRSFPITVYDLVALGAWCRVGMFKGYGREEKERIDYALNKVNLTYQAHQLIGSLSGGQLQRALFARLMVRDPQVFLLDEPLTAIDEHTAEQLLDIMAEWHKAGRTVIAVLHDIELVRQRFPQTLLLASEVVAWGDTSSVLCEDNLQKARHLILKGF